MPIRLLNVIALAALLAILLWALFPGRFDADSAWMYAQSAELRNFNDWHSPLLTLMMMATRRLIPGPAILFVLQLSTWTLGVLLLSDGLIRSGRRWAGLAVSAACATPLIGFIFVDVNKDTAMAAVGMVLVALLVRAALSDRRLGRAAWLGPIVLALVFLGLRPNAFTALAPLLAAAMFRGLGPPRGGWMRWASATAVALAVLMAADAGIKYGALKVERTHNIRTLMIFDLAGIDRFSAQPVGADLLGPEFPSRATTCYSPKGQDPFEWGPCSPYGARMAEMTRSAEGRKVVYVAWARAVVSHPISYLRHRAAAFDQLNRIACQDCIGGMTAGVSIERPWRLEPKERVTPLALAFEQWANRMYVSDLNRGVVWLIALVACLGVLAARLRHHPHEPFTVAVAGIAGSALAYDLALFIIGVGSASRYLHWTIMMGAIAVIMTVSAVRPPPAWAPGAGSSAPPGPPTGRLPRIRRPR